MRLAVVAHRRGLYGNWSSPAAGRTVEMPAGRWAWLGILAACGFLVSGVTYALTTLGLAGPTEPAFAGDLDAYLAQYLQYRRRLFVLEQLENWSLASALVALGLLGQVLHTARSFSDRLTSQLAATLLLAGSLLVAATQIYYVGALDRILDASTVREFDAGVLSTMTQAIGRTDDYLENFGFLLMAFALIGIARVSTPKSGWPRAWTVLCVLLAVALLAVVLTSFIASDLNDPLLLVTGVVLAPVWSVWLARRLAEKTSVDPA